MEEEKKTENPADTIVVSLASLYGADFNVVLRCKPDLKKGIVNVEMKESYKNEED